MPLKPKDTSVEARMMCLSSQGAVGIFLVVKRCCLDEIDFWLKGRHSEGRNFDEE